MVCIIKFINFILQLKQEFNYFLNSNHLKDKGIVFYKTNDLLKATGFVGFIKIILIKKTSQFFLLSINSKMTLFSVISTKFYLRFLNRDLK